MLSRDRLCATLCFHLCAHVRDYDNDEDDYFTFSSSAPLRRSKGRRGRMKDRREKTTEEDMEFVCLYVCVCVRTGLYLHGKSSYLLFEVGSISVLRKYTEEGAADSMCVCVCVFNREKNIAGAKKKINH